MPDQTQWTLLESFPATVQTDSENENHAQPHQRTAGVLHVEQPLTPPENVFDPHLQLALQLPGEEDIQLDETGLRQLYDVTSIAADDIVDMRTPLQTLTPDGDPEELACIIYPVPTRTAPEAFIIALERNQDDPTVLLTLTVDELGTLVSHLDTIHPN